MSGHGVLDDVVHALRNQFADAQATANGSAGPNDDRALIMAIEGLSTAVMAVAAAIIGTRPQGGNQ